MKRSWWYQFIFFLVVTIVSVMTIIPTVFNHTEESKYPIKSKIALGLDLQGGLYMILGIDFPKAYRDEVTAYARKIEYHLKDTDNIVATLGNLDTGDIHDPKHEVVIANPQDVERAKESIKKYFGTLIRMTGEKGNVLEYALSQQVRTQLEEQSSSKAIEVIRNRIDEFGVTEPEILSQGKDRIIVQLPGVKDIERAKELIGRTAKLEFKIVNDTVPGTQIGQWLEKVKAAGVVYDQNKESFSRYVARVNETLKNDLPMGYQMAFQKTTSKATNKIEISTPYLVEAAPRITGDDLQDARVQIDQQKNEPYVSLEFKANGAKRFEDVTGSNIGKRMAVILDGNVYTAPTIQSKIGGGRAQITLGSGGFNKVMAEARDIALVLRAGALPVQLDFLEQRVVGPSLGSDSVHKAVVASLIACAVLFIFCIFYYRLSGVIAIATLVLNVLILIACLAGFEATLTLPGIAGIALTVGMAVDVNIIIYERIREEVRRGASFYKSVEAGFESSFWTVVDAHITQAMAGFCLLNFGTGPIRGFAVTLLIGIAVTVYTSYFVNKIFFEFYMDKVEGQDLSI